ncbi:CehA/McbA family metallohydrolase [Clostridium sp.]|uniref:CehA/McbA family metallohydrolase n=1 Tax=Clostridium sp. TaxID=1506 RepID=UPI003216FFEA
MAKKKKYKDEKKDKIKLNHYFGVPHSHTSYSSGEGCPYEAYEYAKKRGLDFLVVTDHCKKLRSTVSTEYLKKFGYTKDKDRWSATISEADKRNEKKKGFLALIGYELSTEYLGHINIYNCNDLAIGRFKNKNSLVSWCDNHPQCIICINHPNNSITKVPYDNSLNKYINFIEVGNGTKPFKYNRKEKIYYEFLDNGWQVGAINGQDNHRANWGEDENLTVILSEKLDRGSLINALMKRLTYSTESKYLKLDFHINKNLMGSIIQCSINDKLSFNIRAEDKKNTINSVEIISNGGMVIKKNHVNNKKYKEIFEIKVEKTSSWYIVRVIGEGDKVAISSPIFCYAGEKNKA